MSQPEQNGHENGDNDKTNGTVVLEDKEGSPSTPSSTDSSSSNGDKTRKTTSQTKFEPTREDGFDWGRVLGQGAFGEVLVGIQKKTGQEFAIKKISKKFLKEIKKNQDTVFRERDILKQLDHHPLVVRLHWTFQNPDYLFFVMDYCSKGEFLALLKQHGSLNVECTRFYLAEMVVALEYMHSRGVIHRDFKPENILVTEDGHIKVIDFGTAKIANRERTGSFEGTAEYMSPEAALCIEGGTVDWRCDLWSLGVILYQCITGQLPFRGGTPWETMKKIRERDFVWPEPFPAEALDLCKKLMVSEDERLGKDGYDEIKSHPFFKGIDWDHILETSPPAAGPMDPLPVFPKKSRAEDEDSEEEIEEMAREKELEKEKENQKKKGEKEKGGLSDSTDSGGIERWEKFLSEGEKIIKTGAVSKKRRFMNVKRRQLILTDSPRLIYVDPVAMKAKGTIPFTNLSAVAKTQSQFIIKTQGRDFNFEDKGKGATDWAKAINAAAGSK